ncbi:MAG: enoyl-CoA hydratase/isomerase family protein [Dehalococcoidales bacterium]|nr:enoyl-CoA hydratase/isomerase family protein [Dehalococcoidales bacterium]
MGYNLILYEKDKESGAAVITFNKPERLNAWSGGMKTEIMYALDDARADTDIVGVIITGAGRAFGAGGIRQGYSGKGREGVLAEHAVSESGQVQAHYDWLPGDDERHMRLQSYDTPHLLEEILEFEKPTICALNGVVAGGQIGLFGCCDIRIASDRGQFRLAFTRTHGVPDVTSTYWLTRLVGLAHTLEMCYTNDFLDAQELLRIGLVNHVVPHDELIPYCKDMVKKMKQIPPLHLLASKKVIRKVVDCNDVWEARMLEQWGGEAVRTHSDTAEAAKSFWERRDPVYTGRSVFQRKYGSYEDVAARRAAAPEPAGGDPRI